MQTHAECCLCFTRLHHRNHCCCCKYLSLEHNQAAQCCSTIVDSMLKFNVRCAPFKQHDNTMSRMTVFRSLTATMTVRIAQCFGKRGPFPAGNLVQPFSLIPPRLADEQLEAFMILKLLSGEVRGASGLDAALTSALAL